MDWETQPVKATQAREVCDGQQDKRPVKESRKEGKEKEIINKYIYIEPLPRVCQSSTEHTTGNRDCWGYSTRAHYIEHALGQERTQLRIHSVKERHTAE